MGGERWIEADSDELERLKVYLAGITSLGVDGKYGWWLDWREDFWGEYDDDDEDDEDDDEFSEEEPQGGPRLEVGYSFGGLSSNGSAIVCREIAKRFKITRIGGGDGWYSDEDWEDGDRYPTMEYGNFTSWADWIKDYKLEWSMYYKLFEPQPLADMETWIVSWFKERDLKMAEE